jgi:hypothetical protein
MNRRTMLTMLSAGAAIALPGTSNAAEPTKVTFEIRNGTSVGFQTYVKSLGQEWSVPTPPRITTTATVSASDLVLLLFEAGPHGDKKRAYSVNISDDPGPQLTVKLLANMDDKGVFVASSDGAEVDEISVLIFLNS